MKKNIKTVLILGSGGLKIGQAGEFDYSGSQAIKALKEEGIRTILINPNIATIQTSEGLADKVYFLPITWEFVCQVIQKEKPEGILLSFGGQTALNCGVELFEREILTQFNVQVLGTPISSIKTTEDRDLFVKCLDEIGLKTPRSIAANTLEEVVEAAKQIGFPLMIRAAYALGGRGSGICRDENQLIRRANEAFSSSPQVLLEEWLGGWKEIEYEVVRDGKDNCVTVCNMENFDPLGIHTGESIVVAPSQTLTNKEYHHLREISLKAIRHIGIVGECNIQFALDNRSEDYRIIEVNARLSRSSALASKATGYPLAYTAAKIALGYPLTEIENSVTKVTKACFEPALDYIVVKIPRWDLKKFKEVDQSLGSEMKSVGEVMGIGRTFAEALQKSLRMIGIGTHGFLQNRISFNRPLEEELHNPTDLRIFAIAAAMEQDWPLDKIYKYTKVDYWFLYRLDEIINCKQQLEQHELDKELMLKAKKLGFSDFQIGHIKGLSNLEVRGLRKEMGITPFVKQIDTLAAEYPAQTNYLYMTYNAQCHDLETLNDGIIVLGSGAYRIGSSVEFDWCCVNSVLTARNLGQKTIMINYNPETVSTDYDTCDRLYFEEITLERTLDIYEFENPEGVIVSMGGQIPNNLATRLNKANVNILGTSAESIDRAEDRHKFSSLLDRLKIDQPEWKELTSLEEATSFANQIGYPVLIRPSYVLSGAAMNVVWDDESLAKFLEQAAEINPKHPVVISNFLENCKEVEMDAVAKNGEILIYAIGEHVENAGVHSGDATIMLPAQRLYIETLRRVKKVGRQIAKALNITGPFNIQFLAKDNHIKVIECNLRASRSFPFCSKVFKHNMIKMATEAILDAPITPINRSALDLDYVGVKAAQFSFSRLKGADPTLGVEMASTGEVGCLGHEVSEAFLKAFLSVGFIIPKKKILLSTGPLDSKHKMLESIKKLSNLGYQLCATTGTSHFLSKNGIAVETLYRPDEEGPSQVITALKNKEIDLVINIPKSNLKRELTNEYLIRRTAVDFEIPLITNLQVAIQMVEALEYYRNNKLEILSWDEY